MTTDTDQGARKGLSEIPILHWAPAGNLLFDRRGATTDSVLRATEREGEILILQQTF